MSNIIPVPNSMSEAALEHVLLKGDLSKLNERDRLAYYNAVCESVGLNPLTRPFDYITLNGRLTLYARKDATDQLRKIHKVSIQIVETKVINEIYIVSVSARDASGREDAATGAVSIVGLKGDSLANAFLKAETKAKRRVTLSICGLGMLDETEIETIPSHEKAKVIRERVANSESTASVLMNRHEPQSLGDFEVTFGKKHIGKKLSDIAPDELTAYVNYFESEASKKRRPLEGKVLELVEATKAYLAELEMDAAGGNYETR